MLLPPFSRKTLDKSGSNVYTVGSFPAGNKSYNFF